MTDETSSADPQALFAYADTGLRIDAQLEASAAALAAVLGEFAATCTEYPLGIDASLADPLRAYARRNVENDLWVRSVAEQFVQADTGVVADPLVGIGAYADDVAGVFEQVELPADGALSADDLNGWEPILPNAADPYTIEIALQREQVQQFLSPVVGIDLSSQPADPGSIALDGLKLVFRAVGDAPSDCNDAFARMAQAIPQGPDAVRDALQKSRPGCSQSRSLIRLSGVLADGTPIDIQAEAALDQFAMQMTAMADQLGGNGAGARRVALPDDAEVPAVGPGRWVKPNRSGVSQRSLDYQYRVTGAPLGHEYELNGVVFDGYDAFTDTLIEAKGERYAELLAPKNQHWSTAGDGLVKEARGQIKAAQGRGIIWYVAEQAAADRITELFAQSDIEGIVVEYRP